ncbi:MAG: surface-adhesin E family protein [Casimicrobiaceae bacterium]
MKAFRLPPFPMRVAVTVAVALALAPAICAADNFVYLGSQPDGAEVYVQALPAVAAADGRRQGWFRTTLKKPQPINDANGETRQYVSMLAYNVADCAKRTMGAAAMIYHDDKLAVVARFEIPPKELELRKIKANTLGDSMLNWLCTTKKPPSPVVKSPGTDSPFK